LPDKIEKAKEIVEVGKNIAALKEEKESLQKQLSETQSTHAKAMKVADDATKAEIESLKQTISDQAEFVHSREAEAESVKKMHEDATVAMRTKLEWTMADLDLVDSELKSKLFTFRLFPSCFLQAHRPKTGCFALFLQTLMLMAMAPASSNSKPSTSTWPALRLPVLR
jgi:small-conductance mechanosensitive channel